MLVGISLLLTFGLWSYQPNNDVYNGQNLRNSVDIGGEELTKQAIIEPSKIMFHASGEHFGFVDQSAQHNLFKDIQLWTLYDFKITQEKVNSKDKKQVEIVFPEAVPMTITPGLFTFDQVDTIGFPEWSFKRMVITFNQKKSILQIHFISENGGQQAIATVNNSSKYDLLIAKLAKKNGLEEFIAFDKGREPIYIPAQNVTMIKRKITIDSIVQTKLVQALFREPSIVDRSNGNYSDGVRGMRILNDGRKMEYYNTIDPDINPDSGQINAAELIELSLKNINDHKGWTDDYRLVSIDPPKNKIRYRMYYEGYPAFSDTELTIIEQQWRNNELYKYNRSLIKLKRVLDSNEVTLQSGSAIIDYLKTSYASTKDIGLIQGIQLGYEYHYQSDTSNIITLVPAWFIKVNDHWQNFKDLEPKKGGALDAMEPN